jgi:Raf kinase inhibitor-like YbhB/YbcL family protein
MRTNDMPARLLHAFFVALIGISAVGFVAAQQPPAGAQGGGRGGGGARGPAVPGLMLTSTAWPDGSEIPPKHAGQMGVSPALSWTNVPMGTVEFVLLMNDPEPVRPAGSVTGDITHWLVVKIPATATSLPEGAGAAQSTTLPAGARQVQPYRGPGAGPQGPPHHYTLTLYALNAPLEGLADSADRAAVMAAMEGKVLARGIFNGRFMQRPAAAQ